MKLSELSGVHRVNIYDTLRGLKKKGLANTVLIDGKTHYQAADPKVIKTLLEEKANKLNKILPQLEIIKTMTGKETQVGVYQGFQALKNIFDRFLETDKERVVYGVPQSAPAIFSDFLNQYHKKRVSLKRRMRHIYNSDAKDRITYLNGLKYTEARYLDKEYDSPVATLICGEEVVLTLWEKNPVFIVIVNQKIANAYRKYFEILWEKAHK